jgi:hypothetical protein
VASNNRSLHYETLAPAGSPGYRTGVPFLGVAMGVGLGSRLGQVRVCDGLMNRWLQKDFEDTSAQIVPVRLRVFALQLRGDDFCNNICQ